MVNFANGKGAAQVRKDFRKAAGDELTFCENPDGSKLTNSGSEKVNNESQPTNEPHICGYVPPVKKKVIAEGSQGGANNDADDKVVYPGQKVEYRLTTQPKLPPTSDTGSCPSRTPTCTTSTSNPTRRPLRSPTSPPADS